MTDVDKDPGLYSRDEYEVKAGKIHHLREDGKRVLLRKGDRFHPTLKQANTGSLEHKATKVRDGGRPNSVTVGVDFDGEGNIVREAKPEASPPAPGFSLGALPWGSSAAKRKAEDEGLSVDELEAVGSTGATGFVTDDVNRALAAREE